MFFKRSSSPEVMDDFSIRDERIDEALQELDVINRYLGGNKVSHSGIKLLFNGERNKISILDVGAGSSDNIISYKNGNIKTIAVDMNFRACSFNKKKYPYISTVCADAALLPFKDDTFDAIHASLFLHHFTEDKIRIILTNFLCIAKHGIIINDLRRSLPAYLGIKILTGVFSKSRMVKHDAPLSVKRGFIKKDIEQILSGLHAANYIIKRKWAFRWLVVIYKQNSNVMS